MTRIVKRPSTTTLTLDDIELEVDYHYTPGIPAVMYLPNGDPGYPADPPEVEIVKVTLWGLDVTKQIPDDIWDTLDERIMENIDEEEGYDEGY